MNGDDTGAGDIEGLSVDAAVERVVAREGSRDHETVRGVLETVAEDGAVTWTGVEEALGDVSTIVATPETRAELAGVELREARETATAVGDLAVVETRLTEFEDRLETVEHQVEDLQSRLGRLVDRAEARADLYAVAVDLQRLESAANEVQRTADELKIDLEEFEAWLSEPSVRYRELEGDLDAISDSLEDLEGTVGALTTAAEAGGESGLAGEIDDLGALWFGSVLEHRTHQFMIEDVRVELAEFREWAGRENGDDSERLDEIANRLDGLEARTEAIGERLDEVARAAWIERFAEEIANYARDLDAIDKPADWGEVDRLLGERRAIVE